MKTMTDEEKARVRTHIKALADEQARQRAADERDVLGARVGDGRFMALIVGASLLGFLVFGCGGGPQTAPSQQPPTPTTVTLSGEVTESAPTTANKIPGALVIVVDGANTGKSANADGAGNYSIGGLTRGTFAVGFRADGYQDTVRSVTMDGNTTLTAPMAPTPRTLITDRADALSGGDSLCSDGVFLKPCKIVTLNIHNGGTMAATLQWDVSSTDLDLSLWRGSTLIASSTTASGRTEIVSSAVTGGSIYELHITYYLGATITPFRIHVSHPN